MNVADHKIFQGGGQDISFYTQSHALCWYDKKAESCRHKGFPNGLYSDAWQLPRGIDALRMETRCGNPSDIRSTLKWAGILVASLTLEDLFQSEISQAVLLKEFEALRSYIPPLGYTGSLSELIEAILTHNPTISPTDTVKSAVILKLTEELGSETATDKLLRKIYSPSTISRRKSVLKTLKSSKTARGDILDEIKRQLTDFIPVYFGGKMPP